VNDLGRLTGTYLLGLEPMLITVADGDLRFRLGGVPEGLAARLVPSGRSYIIESSQLQGAVVDFAPGDPAPGGQLGRTIDFVRVADTIEMPGGRGLRLGEVRWEPDEEDAYRHRTARILETRDGHLIDWTMRWPKWRFVEWLSRQSQFIFHGSPLADLDVFAPRRTSVEIMDQGGTGNRAAVYGTPYGLWAMWFAVIDRAKLKGSIRNGAMRWHDRAGNPVDVYHFSIHKDYVGGDIWRTGTLYLLPRESFAPIPFYGDGPDSSEWASTTEVRPLARLTIDPGDFPFRDQVGGHDDGELIAAEEVGDIVMSKVRAARRVPGGGLMVTMAWDEEVAGVWDEYLATRERFTPDVTRSLKRESENIATMEVRGPEGFLQAYERTLAAHGVEVSDP
jgi:hypothetical protein